MLSQASEAICGRECQAMKLCDCSFGISPKTGATLTRDMAFCNRLQMPPDHHSIGRERGHRVARSGQVEGDRAQTGGIERRHFLLASGGLVAVLGATPAIAQPSPTDAMAQWNAAATIPLWSGAAPNGGFSPQKLPADSPPFFLRNIDQPY